MTKSGFRRLVNRTGKAVQRIAGRNAIPERHVPQTVYPEDTYLVSYPRSGNTWVRFMIANLVRPPGVEVTFQNLTNLVPDVHKDMAIVEMCARPRFIKSHAPLESRYPRVVYLVRDGRDVCVSYYHYQRTRLPPGTTLAEYLLMDHWPCSWGEHVSSWLDAQLPQERLLLIRYEDMYADPENELQRVASFAGLDATPAQIEKAVHKSAFDSMRQIEERSGHPQAGTFSGRFVRSGRVNDWQRHFGPAERQNWKQSAIDNQALVRLGYEKSLNW